MYLILVTGFRQSGDYNTTLNREVRISENGTGCVDIEVVDDDITEGPEQFLVDISLPSGTIMGILIQPNSTATVTILDDDGMYRTQTCIHQILIINVLFQLDTQLQ